MTTTRSPRPPSGPPQPPPYNWKATLWLVVGMLVVIGAMGVFMRVIPTPFTQPAPTTVPTPQPAVTPQPAATTAPAATVAPTPLVITLGATAPTQAAGTQPTVQPAGQPTLAPTGAPVVQPTTGAPAAPTNAPTQPARAQATPAPTVDPTLAAEILPAYQHYWDVLDDAVSTLDESKLGDAMDGPALIAAQTYIKQLRDQNKAGVGTEDHSVTILSATSEDAVVHDHVVDHSVFVDATTRDPLPTDQQGTNTESDNTYYLRKVDGVWKVVGAS